MKLVDVSRTKVCSICGEIRQGGLAPFLATPKSTVIVLLICRECFEKRFNSFGCEGAVVTNTLVRGLLGDLDFSIELESVNGDKGISWKGNDHE